MCFICANYSSNYIIPPIPGAAAGATGAEHLFAAEQVGAIYQLEIVLASSSVFHHIERLLVDFSRSMLRLSLIHICESMYGSAIHQGWQLEGERLAATRRKYRQ